MADEHQEQSNKVGTRFARASEMTLAEASGDPTMTLTACADCGEPVLKAVGESRLVLCGKCFDRRVAVLVTAAGKGFHLGL